MPSASRDATRIPKIHMTRTAQIFLTEIRRCTDDGKWGVIGIAILRVYWIFALLAATDLLLILSSAHYRAAMGNIEMDQMDSILLRFAPCLCNAMLCVVAAVRGHRGDRVSKGLVCIVSGIYAIQGALGLIPFAGYLFALTSPIAPLYLGVLHAFASDGIYVGMGLMLVFCLLNIWMIASVLRSRRGSSSD